MDRVWTSAAFPPILGKIRVKNVSDLDFILCISNS